MKKEFLNIYNNLVKLTRNKILYKNTSNNETFSDRLTMFFCINLRGLTKRE